MPITLGIRSLYVSVAVLLAGNGLQNIFLTVYAKQNGFPLPMIGLMGSNYFLGFIIGCLFGPKYLNNVGHIRTFSALAAIAAIIALLHSLIVEPITWVILKGLTGFCFATLYLVIESWINSITRNNTRGLVIAKYRMADVLGTLAGQFIFLFVDELGAQLFIIYAILIMLSVVPISLTKVYTPTLLEINPVSLKKSFKETWFNAPVSLLGVLLSGFANGSFWALSPIFVMDQFNSVKILPFVIVTFLLGGALVQYPIGSFSDRVDRRKVIMAMGLLGVCASTLITFVTIQSGLPGPLFWVGVLAYGAGSAPIYSLSMAHANDWTDEGNIVSLSSLLLISSSTGSVLGPIFASSFIDFFTTKYFFLFCSSAHLLLFFLCIWRIGFFEAIPIAKKDPFLYMPRTTPMIAKVGQRIMEKMKNPKPPKNI